jgi:2-hydroxychromene-2-carboxylate isomerase
MTAKIDYYFTIISPWSYLGLPRFLALVEDKQVAVAFKPIIVSQLFAQTGGQPLAQRHPSRQAYRLQELPRWAKYLELPLTLHPAHFPANDSVANCILLAMLSQNMDETLDVMAAFHRAVWVDDLNIADEAVLMQILTDHGVDSAALLAAAKTEETKAALQANTDEAIARGVFGLPSYCVGDEIFWGQDRIEILGAMI